MRGLSFARIVVLKGQAAESSQDVVVGDEEPGHWFRRIRCAARWTANPPREPDFCDPESRATASTCQGLRMRAAYVPDSRSLEDPHFACKLAWLTAPTDALAVGGHHRTRFRPQLGFQTSSADDEGWDPSRIG